MPLSQDRQPDYFITGYDVDDIPLHWEFMIFQMLKVFTTILQNASEHPDKKIGPGKQSFNEFLIESKEMRDKDRKNGATEEQIKHNEVKGMWDAIKEQAVPSWNLMAADIDEEDER